MEKSGHFFSLVIIYYEAFSELLQPSVMITAHICESDLEQAWRRASKCNVNV